jgi:hypothetical protein
MRYNCPFCSWEIVSPDDTGSVGFCSNCRSLFRAPLPQQVPPWILGVLVVLVGNWQVLITL